MVTGYKGPDILFFEMAGRNTFISTGIDIVQSHDVYFTTFIQQSGVISDVSPVENVTKKNITGHSIGAYVEIFYNRLYIEPIIFNLGNVFFDRIEFIKVWNAYLREDKDMLSISATGDTTGITLTGQPAPYTLKPLVELQYQVSISIDGPEQIDITYNYDFPGSEDDGSSTWIGVRVISGLGTFPLQYRLEMTEVLKWSTSILNSYNGTEQRIKIRSSPRQELKVSSYIPPEQMTPMKNKLYGLRGAAWSMPIWFECRKVDSPVSLGDTVVNVSTLYGDFREGEPAIIYDSNEVNQVFEIDSFTENTITIKGDANQNFSSNALVAPVRISRLLSSPNRVSTGYSASISGSFESLVNANITGVDLDEQYEGLDVLLLEPSKTSDNTYSTKYDTRVDVIDNISGVVTYNSPWDNTRPTKTVEFLFTTQQEIWEFKQFLYKISGKLKSFWMPSWEIDMVLDSTGTIEDNFEVISQGFDRYSSNRKYIVFWLTDGSRIYREIIESTLLPNGNEQIVINTPINIDSSTIDHISYLEKQRLNTDNIEIKRLGNNVSRVTFPIIEVQ